MPGYIDTVLTYRAARALEESLELQRRAAGEPPRKPTLGERIRARIDRLLGVR